MRLDSPASGGNRQSLLGALRPCRATAQRQNERTYGETLSLHSRSLDDLPPIESTPSRLLLPAACNERVAVRIQPPHPESPGVLQSNRKSGDSRFGRFSCDSLLQRAERPRQPVNRERLEGVRNRPIRRLGTPYIIVDAKYKTQRKCNRFHNERELLDSNSGFPVWCRW